MVRSGEAVARAQTLGVQLQTGSGFSLNAKRKLPLHPLFSGERRFSCLKNWGTSNRSPAKRFYTTPPSLGRGRDAPRRVRRPHYGRAGYPPAKGRPRSGCPSRGARPSRRRDGARPSRGLTKWPWSTSGHWGAVSTSPPLPPPPLPTYK